MVLAVLCGSGQAHAQQTGPAVEPAPPAPTLTVGRRVGGVAAALVPGVLLHGSGAFVAGDRRAAKVLVSTQWIGFAAMFAAAGGLATSGASRKLVPVLGPFILTGFAAFNLPWLADIYAASTGGRVARPPRPSQGQWAFSYRHVFDPQFDYRNFAHAEADIWHGFLRASGSAWVALDDNNQRLRVELAPRVLGARADRPSKDGSFFEPVGAVTYHGYGDEGFRVWTAELTLNTRLDLSRVGPSLAGSFAEGSLGAGLEMYDFGVQGSRLRDNLSGLGLGRFAFGVYLGDRLRGGELRFYYDHRHDDYAAGLTTQGVGGGFLGHVGIDGFYFMTRSWGVTWGLELGSAYIGWLGLKQRWGVRDA